jgi:hypothetical protein
MAEDMLSTPYISMFDRPHRSRGRPRLHTEEEMKQIKRDNFLRYYDKNRETVVEKNSVL